VSLPVSLVAHTAAGKKAALFSVAAPRAVHQVAAQLVAAVAVEIFSIAVQVVHHTPPHNILAAVFIHLLRAKHFNQVLRHQVQNI
jgi:hypothetical protein